MLNEFKKYSVWLFIGAILILIYKCIDNYKTLLDVGENFVKMTKPFIWGFVIAYFLVIIMKKIEKRFNVNRLISLFLTYFLFFSTITVLIMIMAPVIINNIFDLINSLPNSINKLQEFVNIVFESEFVEKMNIKNYINLDISNYTTITMRILNSVASGILSFTSNVFNTIIGIIISMYILLDIDKFKEKTKKILLAFLGKEKADEVIIFIKMCDDIFKNFFVGKMIDSMIIGVLCYIGLLILDAPYAMLSSLIVGVFNMIPYIGPIIGAVPAIIFALFVSPIKALWVALFILLLQQLDGNIIGPKILGDKVGISPFGIILAITLGGGYFGIVGMLVAVPIYKVITVIFDRHINKKIEKTY